MTIYALGDLTPVLPEDDDYYIAETATVIGNVRLGAGATVWFGAVLRGDNELIDIGVRTNIQENCVFHTDPGFPISVGTECTIGHSAILHGCTIGDRSMVGMGAIVMNGAKIGTNCLVGAGALVSEGTVIPDGSLVLGVPARVLRPVDEKTRAQFPISAEIYARKGKTYRAALKRVTPANR